MHDEWLKARLLYLRGLKAPSDYQRLLLLLAGIQHPTPEEEEKLTARKARDRELYNSAGLLILAGLVDTQTGRPASDRGELLGALLELAEVPKDELQRKGWKRAGDALLAGKMKG